MLLAAFFVGTDVVSVKYALEGFPPLVLMPIRYALAGLLLLASLRLLRRGIGLAPRDLAALAGLGLVGVSLNQGGYTVGLSLTSGSNAALIFASAPCGACCSALCWGWSARRRVASWVSPSPSGAWPSSSAGDWVPAGRP